MGRPSNEERRAYYAANAERLRAQKRAHTRANPAANRASSKAHYEANAVEINRRRRAAKYGMTPEQLDAMEQAQNGACEVCGLNEPGGRGGKLHVDHDHLTGKVRGLLCHNCNLALGRVNDNVDLLMSLAAYLLKSQDVLVPTKQ